MLLLWKYKLRNQCLKWRNNSFVRTNIAPPDERNRTNNICFVHSWLRRVCWQTAIFSYENRASEYGGIMLGCAPLSSLSQTSQIEPNTTCWIPCPPASANAKALPPTKVRCYADTPTAAFTANSLLWCTMAVSSMWLWWCRLCISVADSAEGDRLHLNQCNFDYWG